MNFTKPPVIAPDAPKPGEVPVWVGGTRIWIDVQTSKDGTHFLSQTRYLNPGVIHELLVIAGVPKKDLKAVSVQGIGSAYHVTLKVYVPEFIEVSLSRYEAGVDLTRSLRRRVKVEAHTPTGYAIDLKKMISKTAEILAELGPARERDRQRVAEEVRFEKAEAALWKRLNAKPSWQACDDENALPANVEVRPHRYGETEIRLSFTFPLDGDPELAGRFYDALKALGLTGLKRTAEVRVATIERAARELTDVFVRAEEQKAER